jgi:hypothetical protein
MPDYLSLVEKVLGWVKGLLPVAKRLWKDYLNGPAASVRLLDPVNCNHLLEIRNVGGGTVTPRVFLDRVTDNEDRFLPSFVPIAEVNCAGDRDWPRLFGSASALFTILGVDWRDEQRPSLWFHEVVRRRDEKGEEYLQTGSRVLVPPVPMGEHKEIRLTVRVVLCSGDDSQRELVDKVLLYAVVPELREFKVRYIKPRHKSIFDY